LGTPWPEGIAHDKNHEFLLLKTNYYDTHRIPAR
jgi:hypothetical protein